MPYDQYPPLAFQIHHEDSKILKIATFFSFFPDLKFLGGLKIQMVTFPILKDNKSTNQLLLTYFFPGMIVLKGRIERSG